MRSRVGKSAVQAVDEPARFVQFSPQGADDGISAVGAARACASVALVGGFEFVGDVGDVTVQLAQKCLRLRAARVIAHLRILSPILNVRASWVTK